jgi:hypothetical protein
MQVQTLKQEHSGGADVGKIHGSKRGKTSEQRGQVR